MALTLNVEQRLIAADLVVFYDETAVVWFGAAQRTYNFIRGDFPVGATIRPGDVSKALVPLLEVNEALRQKLDEDKLRGKFWISDFADLIIDRTWAKLSKGNV